MKKKDLDEYVVEQISQVNVNDLLNKNIYDYGIDVLEDRVLADFRDGFKPAQRRILWTARDLKAFPDSKTVKSARITGDCMGKYHPHSSAYGSLVNLVNSDYPVLFGQGNYGDINNGPAAERYTEAKISDIGMKCLECMPVADMVPNYGGDLMEPVVIPSRFPNFFVNECEGIAVGLKCAVPAHNLEEIVETLKAIVRKGDGASIKDIMKHIKGPDYEYGGKINASMQIKQDLMNKIIPGMSIASTTLSGGLGVFTLGMLTGNPLVAAGAGVASSVLGFAGSMKMAKALDNKFSKDLGYKSSEHMKKQYRAYERKTYGETSFGD